MTSVLEEKKKRATKRYPYACNGHCSVGDVAHELKILNISTSGIQFATRNKIETKQEIQIRWNDSRFGAFHPMFLIAREIHNPDSREYPFFYGAQYSNLNEEMRDSLFKLLKHFKDQSTQDNKEQVEKITPGYLFSVIDQGVFFLKTALVTQNAPVYFEELMKKMPDYERTSFSLSDDYAKLIQKLSTYHIHCDILKSLADPLRNQPNLHARYFEKLQDLLQVIGDCAEEAPLESAKIKASQASEELKKKLINQLSESGNRLYYSTQGMLDSVIKQFDSIVTDASEFKEIYRQIKLAYIQKKSQQTEIQPSKYRRKAKLTEEDFSQVEKIVDVRTQYEPTRNSPRLLLLLLVAVACYMGYAKIDKMRKLDAFVKEMDLGVPVRSFTKMGTQLNIIFGATDWAALTDEKKMEVYQKIYARLAEDPWLANALMFDERQNVIRFINENQKPK